ncbi:hypothetical protein L596_003686 [Steinernema carpocapsae]|uniref:Uncharacterized protein n=1 Tax=Steinernema carpocapsae TaxID=34508 RepID=A0A4U8UUZ7_STECR|nr:hypothetical protein L596_003686 [Steinernema carpocapsae]
MSKSERNPAFTGARRLCTLFALEELRIAVKRMLLSSGSTTFFSFGICPRVIFVARAIRRCMGKELSTVLSLFTSLSRSL